MVLNVQVLWLFSEKLFVCVCVCVALEIDLYQFQILHKYFIVYMKLLWDLFLSSL